MAEREVEPNSSSQPLYWLYYTGLKMRRLLDQFGMVKDQVVLGEKSIFTILVS